MKRSVILFVALGAVLILVVWYFLLISPRQADLDSIQDDIDAADATAQGLRGEKAALLAIRDSELSYRRASAELERSIPLTPELAEFIESINLLADDTGVVLNTLSPGLPELVEGVPFQVLPVQMNVTGQFFEVLGFLYGLEDLERLMRIDALSLAGSPNEAGVTEIAASITGRIFTLAVDLPTPELAPPSPPEEADGEGGEEGEGEGDAPTTTAPADGETPDTTEAASGDGSGDVTADAAATTVGGDS